MRKKYEIDNSLTGAERTKARKHAAYLANKEIHMENAKKYREDNKDKIKEKRKKDYELNRDKKLSSNKEWVEKNKERSKEYSEEYRKVNSDKIKKSKKEYYLKNRKKLLEEQKVYTEQNKEKIKEYRKSRYLKMPEYYVAKSNERRALKLQATREWDAELTALVVTEASDLVRKREKNTGIKWHVDHIIPLCGKEVCGFHVWNNLMVIPAVENLRKGNKMLCNF